MYEELTIAVLTLPLAIGRSSAQVQTDVGGRALRSRCHLFEGRRVEFENVALIRIALKESYQVFVFRFTFDD